jgi:hypothetical protein
LPIVWGRQLLQFIACLPLAACTGCTHWNSTTPDQSLLEPPRMSPDSVVLEMAILDLTPDQDQVAATLWQAVDEQQLAPELRRRLAAQGLRCGIIGAHLPDWIRTGLEEQNRCLQLHRSLGTAAPNQVTMQRRLQCRAGKERCIPVADRFQQLAIRDQADRSTEYTDGQCHLVITADPLGDGRVAVELVPELHHGAPKQHWLGQSGYFRAEVEKQRKRYDEFQVKSTLTPGQTLVLAARGEPERIACAVCESDSPTAPAGRLILLRLAQTQFDDLFAPHHSLSPIATLGE